MSHVDPFPRPQVPTGPVPPPAADLLPARPTIDLTDGGPADGVWPTWWLPLFFFTVSTFALGVDAMKPGDPATRGVAAVMFAAVIVFVMPAVTWPIRRDWNRQYRPLTMTCVREQSGTGPQGPRPDYLPVPPQPAPSIPSTYGHHT